MRRSYGKPDGNQARHVARLRAAGCSVAITSGVGAGFPDLVVGFGGTTALAEVKAPGGKFTPAQGRFMVEWLGDKIWILVTDKDTDALIAWLKPEWR